jgi:hypothetical protein
MKKPALRRFRADTVQDGLRTLRRDGNGYLHFEATVARVGVLSYSDIGGPRELTTEEVLFDPASMQSLVGVPVTDGHPDPILLTPKTAPAAQKGSIYSVRRDGDYLVAAGVITDADLADEVEAKLRLEVSPGYDGDATYKAGLWKDGERFDAQQTARTYNHLAFAKRGQRGRCSRTCGGGPCLCAARADAESQGDAMDFLMELCLKAYPDDAKGALEAYAKAMAALGKAPEEAKPEEAQPRADETEPEKTEPMVRADATAGLRAELEREKAARVAAEKALERQGRAHADSVGRNIGAHLKAMERYRTVTGARADAVGGMTIDQMDRESLVALYPEDEKEIRGYSAVELQAHIKQAFHPTRGDQRVRAARENASGAYADAYGAGPSRGKDAEQDAAVRDLEEYLALNGRRPLNGVAR